MKNIKSFIFICLAAILVFGFTACAEPTTYKEVSAIDAYLTEDTYIVGQYFDPSTITGTVYYSDGTSGALSSAQASYEIKNVVASDAFVDGKFVKAGDATVTIKFGGKSSTDTIKGIAVTALELANLPETASWNAGNTAADVDMSAVTATATLTDGSKVQLAAGEFSVTATADITTGSPKAGTALTDRAVTIDESVTVFGVSYVNKEEGRTITVTPALPAGVTEWKVDVLQNGFGTATGLIAEVIYTSKTADFKYDNSTTVSKAYGGDTATWTVYLTDKDGHRMAVDPDELIFQNIQNSADIPDTEVTLDEEEHSYSVLYKGNLDLDPATFTILKGDDWIQSISAKVKTDEDGKVLLTAEGTATYEDFTFTVDTYYDDEEATFDAGTSGANVKLTNTVIPEAGKTYTTSIQVTYEEKTGVTKNQMIKNVSAKVPEA